MYFGFFFLNLVIIALFGVEIQIKKRKPRNKKKNEITLNKPRTTQKLNKTCWPTENYLINKETWPIKTEHITKTNVRDQSCRSYLFDSYNRWIYRGERVPVFVVIILLFFINMDVLGLKKLSWNINPFLSVNQGSGAIWKTRLKITHFSKLNIICHICYALW